MKRISVCHATRRAVQALEMRERWMAAAKFPERVSWMFAIDDDDAESIAVFRDGNGRWAMGDGQAAPHVIVPAGGGCVRAYNALAVVAAGDIIVCASDDVYPIQDWDTIIEERLGEIERVDEVRDDRGEIVCEAHSIVSRFLCCGDGMENSVAVPLQIVTRGWVDKHGGVFHPRFKSMYGDNWCIERARRDGELVLAMDLAFEHRHPFFKTAPMDEVYEAENAADRYDEGREIYSELLPAPKVALCIICGNESNVTLHPNGDAVEPLAAAANVPPIIRCLESARDAFDELCLVRAIGNQAPDGTVELADKWCQANNKEYCFQEYRNGFAGRDWPHVDDFAAARNLCFKLAEDSHEISRSNWESGPYRVTGGLRPLFLLWLDCDDFLQEIHVRRIREAVDICPGNVNGIRALYSVDGVTDGAMILRERLIRSTPERPLWRWKNAIHETCVIEGLKVECPQIVVFHANRRERDDRSHVERNARILRNELEDAPRKFCYLQTDLVAMNGNGSLDPDLKEEALRAGRIAVASDYGRIDPELIYKVYLNFSILERDKAKEWLLKAFQIQPHRREALAYLAQEALKEGNYSDAVSHYRQMDALPVPSPVPWTHEGLWYARGDYDANGSDGRQFRHRHGRNFLRVKVLEASGNPDLIEMARIEHQEYLKDPEYRALFAT
jgi:tetratricopeptide (TPR) repeat protein